jgi:hypothetical protein
MNSRGAGFPLLRTTLLLRTLHPQYLGANFVWWRTTGRTVSNFVTHEVQDCMAMRTIRSEEYLSADRRFDAALMCPTMSSIFRFFTI